MWGGPAARKRFLFGWRRGLLREEGLRQQGRVFYLADAGGYFAERPCDSKEEFFYSADTVGCYAERPCGSKEEIFFRLASRVDYCYVPGYCY